MIDSVEQKIDTNLGLEHYSTADLLRLFEENAPHALQQNKNKQIFKKLVEVLNEQEINELSKSWGSIHNQVGRFYSVIHKLEKKYCQKCRGDAYTFPERIYCSKCSPKKKEITSN